MTRMMNSFLTTDAHTAIAALITENAFSFLHFTSTSDTIPTGLTQHLFLFLWAVFENTYFMFFFSDFKKKHDFLRFFEMTYQKS